MTRRIATAATIVFLATASTFSNAQPAAKDFPARPIRLIVPFAPGGSTDQLARPIASKLQDLWRQPVVVENRGGAGTVIGTDAVAKSAPDGYTIGMVVAGHTINPSIKASLPYDTARDLVGITQLTRQQMVWVAHPSAPFNTLEELIAYAKRKPDTVTYGSSGHGVATHLTGELLANKAWIRMVHVAYKGAAPAYTDSWRDRSS